MTTSPRFPFLTLCAAVALLAACADDAATDTTTSGSGGSGGESAGPTTTTGTTTATTGTGSTGSSSSASGTGGEGAGTSAGTGGEGTGGSGAGGNGAGGGEGWPECIPENFGDSDATIADVWAANPPVPEPFWLPGLVVTAVSLGGCVEDAFCQIFVQQEDTFASFAAGAQQAIRVQVAPEAAFRFLDVAVGDLVDLGGEPYRDVADGKNELLFFIRDSTPGCMAVNGKGDPQPVVATLADLTVEAYEDTVGPLLVRLDTVSGRPHEPNALFAMWDTENGPDDGGIETVTNMSPFFIPGGVFVGFVPEQIEDFTSVTGVFGQFRPNGGAKYETIYVRSMGDAPIAN